MHDRCTRTAIWPRPAKGCRSDVLVLTSRDRSLDLLRLRYPRLVERLLADRLPEPYARAGLVGWDQKRPSTLQGRHDLSSRRGMEVVAAILEIANGAPRNIRPFGELLLCPVQQATGGAALFGRQ